MRLLWPTMLTISALAVVVVSAPSAHAQYGCESYGQWSSCYGSWCTCQEEFWGQCEDRVIVWAGGGQCPYYCGFGTCIISDYTFQYCNWEECQNPIASAPASSKLDTVVDLAKDVRTLRAHGSFRRVVENDPLGVEGSIELQLSIPDGKFLKKQVFRRAGQTLFSIAWATDGEVAWFQRASGRADEVRPERVQRERERLLAALLAIEPPVRPDASGDDAAPKVQFDRLLSVPTSVESRGSRLRMWRSVVKPSPDETVARSAPAAPQNLEIRLSRRRAAASGHVLPHQLTFSADGQVVEEWVIDRFEVNGALDPHAFALPEPGEPAR